MASDVRDVLDLPTDGARPSKRQKTAAPRPNLKGLAREVQNLGGDNPIAIVPEISTFKKRRFGNQKPATRWELSAFRNSAREDGLTLRHWRRQAASEETEDSAFAKFNVPVDVPQYSDDQYSSTLAGSNDWTKHETDYLMETVKRFDLRWPVIWDRYEYQPSRPEATNEDGTDPATAIVPTPKPRSMEDIKARYYEVAAKMMAVQKPVQYMNPAEFSLHETMTHFDAGAETRRKKYAQDMMSRSKEEAREEESLLIEVRRILARTEKFNQERRDLYNRLDYPSSESTQDLSSFKTSMGLQTLLQNLMNVDKSRKRKSLAGTDGQNTPATAGPSAHPSSTPITENRRESIAASTTGHRDSIDGTHAKPDKPSKKGAQQPERRKLTEQEEQIYGVSMHDRLGSGPTFRYERINKILTTKSHAQHQRITNTLAELDVPGRLTMPTDSVVRSMEKLLGSIQTLLDLRKLSEKVNADLKVEQNKKADREKKNAPPGPSSAPPAASEAAAKPTDVAGDEPEKTAEDASKVDDGADATAAPTATAEATEPKTDEAESNTPAAAEADDDDEEEEEEEEDDDDDEAGVKQEANEDQMDTT